MINEHGVTDEQRKIVIRTAFSLVTLTYQRMNNEIDDKMLKDYYGGIINDESFRQEINSDPYTSLLDGLALLTGTGFNKVSETVGMDLEELYESIELDVFYNEKDLKNIFKLLLFNGHKYYIDPLYLKSPVRTDVYDSFSDTIDTQLHLVTVFTVINIYLMTVISFSNKVPLAEVLSKFALDLARVI